MSKQKHNRGRGRPPGRKEVKAFQVRLGIPLYNALVALAERNRRHQNTEVVIAIERYLTENKLWPPNRSEDTD